MYRTGQPIKPQPPGAIARYLSGLLEPVAALENAGYAHAASELEELEMQPAGQVSQVALSDVADRFRKLSETRMSNNR